MSRLSGPARIRNYIALVGRDTEVCFIGGEQVTFQTAVVDHWDNENSNNRLSNLHLLCRPMNAVKNPRGNAVLRKNADPEKLLSSLHVSRIRVPMVDGPTSLRIQTAEYQKHVITSPNFRHWLFYVIVHLGEVDYNQVVVCGSELVRCHAQTLKGYLAGMTSAAGLYSLTPATDGATSLIRLKPEWESFRKTNEIKAELAHQVKNWQDDPSRK
jgi:hypothetical protein